jgi:phage replication-related protein YjqB (UPF0714/DUF867 family)
MRRRRDNGRSAALLIRLDDPSLAEDLCAHFRRSGFTAELAGGSIVEILRGDAPSAAQERREIELHLRVWRATNPAAAVDLLS